jgi:hypothetical protein
VLPSLSYHETRVQTCAENPEVLWKYDEEFKKKWEECIRRNL